VRATAACAALPAKMMSTEAQRKERRVPQRRDGADRQAIDSHVSLVESKWAKVVQAKFDRRATERKAFLACRCIAAPAWHGPRTPIDPRAGAAYHACAAVARTELHSSLRAHARSLTPPIGRDAASPTLSSCCRRNGRRCAARERRDRPGAGRGANDAAR